MECHNGCKSFIVVVQGIKFGRPKTLNHSQWLWRDGWHWTSPNKNKRTVTPTSIKNTAAWGGTLDLVTSSIKVNCWTFKWIWKRPEIEKKSANSVLLMCFHVFFPCLEFFHRFFPCFPVGPKKWRRMRHTGSAEVIKGSIVWAFGRAGKVTHRPWKWPIYSGN